MQVITRVSRRARWSTVLVWFAFGGLFSSVQGADYFLLADDAPPNDSIIMDKSILPEGLLPGKQHRAISLNPVMGDPSILSEKDTLTLNLFEDVVYTASIDRLTTNINGTFTVRARIDGYPLGYVLISTTGEQSLGSIRIPEKGERYLIQSAPDGQTHFLVDADAETIDALEDDPPLIPPKPTKAEADEVEQLQETMADGPLDPANIDVMVAYTPAARLWAGGVSGMANVIAQAMSNAQLALDNSGTVLTMTLVHSDEVDYTESGSSSTDLTRLRITNDGYLDVVHTWRNQYGADLVALFTKIEDTGGISYLLTSTSGAPAYAFSISRVQQVGWTYTHIHELGHNMGCHHHKEQNVQPGPGLFSYSAGWRWTGTDNGKYCSLMTYESGQYFADGVTHTAVAHFSNPNINYAGVPTGHTADGDNARGVREIKHVVAAYRAVVPPTTPPNPTASTNLCGDKTLTRSGSPPTGVTWYWQGTSCGTRTDLGSGTTYAAVESGTYSIRARDNISGLWSTGCGSVTVTVLQPIEDGPDLDQDCDVDLNDFLLFQNCLSGPNVPHDGNVTCLQADFDGDDDVDQEDFGVLQRCYSGENQISDPSCMNIAPPEMVLIPAGEFQMGDTFSEGSTAERPVHAVYTDAFYMDKYEVTNQQYSDALNWAKSQGNLITVTSGVVYKYNSGTSFPYCDTTASLSDSRITWNGTTFGVTSGKESHPMVLVSWYGAVAYANWRSAMQNKPLCYDLSTWNCTWGSGYRLPTEAEWEKAARGGVAGMRFPWSDSNYIQHARANYYSSSGYSYDNSPTRGYHPTFNTGNMPYTSPVGYFAPNGYGLYDMAGNERGKRVTTEFGGHHEDS